MITVLLKLKTLLIFDVVIVKLPYVSVATEVRVQSYSSNLFYSPIVFFYKYTQTHSI